MIDLYQNLNDKTTHFVTPDRNPSVVISVSNCLFIIENDKNPSN